MYIHSSIMNTGIDIDIHSLHYQTPPHPRLQSLTMKARRESRCGARGARSACCLCDRLSQRSSEALNDLLTNRRLPLRPLHLPIGCLAT